MDKRAEFMSYFVVLLVFFVMFSFNAGAVETVYPFSYTGNYQEFIAPTDGVYQFELWGAQGGNTYYTTRPGGYGGYTSGKIFLNQGTVLYIYVGQMRSGTANSTGFNAGTGNDSGAPGGGATDVRLVSGTWNNFDSLKSRIMVAAGGGGGQGPNAVAGAGGGLIGKAGGYNSPGTQTAAGGKQQPVYGSPGFGYASGGCSGGGGYYGGGAAQNISGASGGSSFISGHYGSDAIAENSTSTNIIHTGQEVHYSGYEFYDTVVIDGDGYLWTNKITTTLSGMPTQDGTSTMTGNTGHGYAKITLLSAGTLEDIVFEGAELVENKTEAFTYDVIIPSDDFATTVSATIIDNSIYVSGLGETVLVAGQTYYITTVSESGNLTIYTFNVRLASFDIDIAFEEVEFEFSPSTNEYNLEVVHDIKSLTPVINASDGISYEISGNDNLKIGNNVVTITFKKESREEVYTFNVERTRKNTSVYNYAYTGTAQKFVVPENGNYKVELWGAGGTGAGYSAYTAGTIYLEKGTELFVYVGHQAYTASTNPATFNNGTANDGGYTAGGATDIRLVEGATWRDFNSLKSRIMVAAGGGVTDRGTAGAAGGLIGYAGGGTAGGTQTATGGRQSTRYTMPAFGIADGGCTGGNGYYPGGAATCANGSGGGSSFISGHAGSDAIAEESTTDNIIHTGQSVHYSGYAFKDTVMIDGKGYSWTTEVSDALLMPNPSGGTYASGRGHAGHGYARITPVYENTTTNSNIYLQSLTVSSGTLDKTFSKEIFEYTLELGEDDTTLTIDATPEDIDAIVTGLKTYDIPSGQTDITITVTATDGTTKNYIIHAIRTASTNQFLLGFNINGIAYEGFDENIFVYNIELPYHAEFVHVSAIKANPNQTISGDGEGLYLLENNAATVNLLSVSEDGQHNQIYTINFTRQKTTLLKSVLFEEINKKINFEDGVFEYTLNLSILTHSLTLDVDPYYDGANIQIEGNKYLGENSKTITITSTLDDLTSSVYTININYITSNTDYNYEYPYTGDVQTFVAPETTYYDIELWGAAGSKTAYGAYTKGKIYLEKDTTLYIYVGRGPIYTLNVSSFNNGTANAGGYTGGGATDVRLVKGATWRDFDSLKSRIMVAAGGGSTDRGTAGAGGGLIGYDGGGTKGGTQTTAGGRQLTNYSIATFGIADGGCTGGNGYYPGGAATCVYGAGGGSSFISGHNGSNAISESSTSANIIHTNQTDHYSGYTFLDTVMIDGKGYRWTDEIGDLELMPASDGTYFASGVGNTGNGYAKISSSVLVPNDNYLESLTITSNLGDVDITFEPWTQTYKINLKNDESLLTIDALPKDLLATVSGLGTIDVPPLDSTHEIVVTAQDGSLRTYELKFYREASSNQYPIDIQINGFPTNLCKRNENYCKYTFVYNEPSYTILLPFATSVVTFNPVLNSKYQTVTYRRVDAEGNKTELSSPTITLDTTNTIEVEITSEDKQHSAIYTYKLNKDETGNNNLASLTITDPSIAIESFHKYTYDYYITVPNDVNSFTVNATPESDKAKPTVYGNTNLKPGMNNVIVIVTAENGETKTYIIHAYKEQSTNVFLNNLEVINANTNEVLALVPEFDPLLNAYTVEVDNTVKKITINASADSAASISGNGTYDLKSGVNSFPITVTNGDNTNTYEINIIKAKNSNPLLANIEIEGHTLNPVFSQETTEYYVYFSNLTSFEFKITPVESTTTYTINGNNLNKEMNEIVITSIAEDKSYKTYTIYAMKDLSTNNYLESITLSTGKLNETFAKETTNYTADVSGDVTSIEITGIPEDKKSSVKGNGIYYLEPGDNIITLDVTNEIGETKTYTITINKKRNSDATLKEVLNNQGSDVVKIDDEKLGYHYLIDVQYEVNKLEVTGIPNASTTVIVGNGIHPLNVGDTDIYLTLTAEDGTIETYIVRVVRDLSTNDDLEYLFVKEGGLSPIFNKTTIYYEVKVPNDITELTIEAIPEDKDAKVEIIGNENLEVGVPKDIIVRVVAPKLNTKDYTLRVTRQAATTENLALLSLTTNRGELTPPFEPDVLNYELEVENNITDITIDAEALSEDVTVEGLGTYKLQVGKNAIPVFVVGTDGVQRDYQIVVTRKASSDASLKTIVVKGHTLSPAFTSTNLNYTLTTSSTKLEFTSIVPTESDATYVVAGNENFTSDTINIVTITVTAPDGETEGLYTIMVTKEGSKNNNLASLSVLGYELLPTFHKGVTFYAVEVDNNVNSIMINATAEDSKSQITGTGLQVIATGENYFDIVVTSEAGTTKTYTILVTKESSSNNYLASLSISDGTLDPEFDKLQNSYNVTVTHDVTKISFSGTLEDANATVEGLKEYDLAVGGNLIEIIVTAEDGSKNIYKVNVTRKEIISAYLKDLVVKDNTLDPVFNKETFEYYITVPSEVTSLEITPTLEDPNAKYEITGDKDFVVGMNEVIITVTSSDNLTTKKYTIYVNRMLSTNNYLEYIVLSAGELSPEFDKETLTYTIDLPTNVDTLTINAKTIDSNATITSGIGTHTLEKGLNKIQIKVKSMIGITRTYTLNVTRNMNDNNYLSSLKLIDAANNNYILNFNKLEKTYNVTVSETTDYLTIEAILEDSSASITGLGVVAVSTGDNSYNVKVTSESGNENVYTINVTKPASSNNFALSITPSSGTFDQTFDKTIETYTLTITEDISSLSFLVDLESEKSTVNGHELKVLPEGISTREIIVTAEDGTEKKYIITVIKEMLSEARLESLTVKDYPFTFNSDTFTYNLQVSGAKRNLLANEITAIAKDSEATVNLMGDLDLVAGIVNTYTIEVIAKDGYTTQTYTLNITRDSETHTIRSAVYGIIRDDEDEDYGIKIEPKTTLDNFIANFENDPTTLKLYDKNGNSVTESRNVYTGDVLALEIAGIRYDQIRVIVTGDTTGDGVVDVLDSSQLNSHILRRAFLESYSFKAGDLNRDTTIDVLDSSKMTMYILRKFTQMD